MLLIAVALGAPALAAAVLGFRARRPSLVAGAGVLAVVACCGAVATSLPLLLGIGAAWVVASLGAGLLLIAVSAIHAGEAAPEGRTARTPSLARG